MPPAKVADVLALMGDAIDNIPGVPGIGEKGAKSLIQEYGSLEDLLARAGEVSRKAYREGLQQHPTRRACPRSCRPSTPTSRSPSTPRPCTATRRTSTPCARSSPSWSSSPWSRSWGRRAPPAGPPRTGRSPCPPPRRRVTVGSLGRPGRAPGHWGGQGDLRRRPGGGAAPGPRRGRVRGTARCSTPTSGATACATPPWRA